MARLDVSFRNTRALRGVLAHAYGMKEAGTMAIFHFHARACTKGHGATASAKTAYYNRVGRYSYKSDLVATWSENMPSWAQNAPEVFWEATDTHERANGVLCKTFEISLPLELDDAARLALARSFAQELAGSKKPYSVSVHSGDSGRDQPHMHLMVSLRENDGLERTPEAFFKRFNAKAPERGGARKDAQWLYGAEQLCAAREAWAKAANLALEKAGFQERISAASLETQEAQGLRPMPEANGSYKSKRPTHKPHPVAIEARAARDAAIAEENARTARLLADWAERKEEALLDAARVSELRDVRLGWLLEKCGFRGANNGAGSVMYTHSTADCKIAVSDAKDGKGEVFIDNKSHSFHGRGPIDLIVAMRSNDACPRDKAAFWDAVRTLDRMIPDQATLQEAVSYKSDRWRPKEAATWEPIPMPKPTQSETRLNAVLDWAEARGFNLDNFAALIRESKIIVTDDGSLAVPRQHGGYFERRMDGVKNTRGTKERGPALIRGPRYDLGSPLILCEGITDAIALSQLYPDAAIAITGGNLYPEVKAEQGQRVYLAFDQDEQGESHAAHYAAQFPQAKRHLPPDGAHDWADWVKARANAKAEMEAALVRAAQDIIEEEEERGPRPGY